NNFGRTRGETQVPLGGAILGCAVSRSMRNDDKRLPRRKEKFLVNALHLSRRVLGSSAGMEYHIAKHGEIRAKRPRLLATGFPSRRSSFVAGASVSHRRQAIPSHSQSADHR